MTVANAAAKPTEFLILRQLSPIRREGGDDENGGAKEGGGINKG